MTKTHVSSLALCVALASCASLGGFEDFTDGTTTVPETGGAAGSSGAKPGVAGKPSATAGTETGASSGTGGSEDSGNVAGKTSQGGSKPTQGGAGGKTVSAGRGSVTDGGETSAGGAPSDSGLLDDCVLLMHFEEASWTQKMGEVQDSSGFGNHGTPSTATLTTTATNLGKFGRAAKLDGTGGVVVPDAASLDATATLSIAAWIYPTSINPNSSGIVSKRTGFGSETAYTLFLWHDQVAGFHLYTDINGEDNRFFSNATFDSNRWYHVAVVFDGSLPAGERSVLYVDGKADYAGGESATQIGNSPASLIIGDLPGGGDRFAGYIDEVAVWQRALSATEVAALHAAKAPLAP